MSILAWNSLASFLFFVLLCGVKGKLKGVFRLPVRTILTMAAVGSCSILFYTFFLQAGMQVLPGQQAFVIQYLWPAMVILWSVPINKESLTAGKIAAILFSFMGVVVTSVNGDLSALLGGNLYGVVMCLISAAWYGLYSALIKRVSFDKEQGLLVGFGFAALVSFSIMIPTEGFLLPTAFTMTGYVMYGLIINAIPFLLWGLALSGGNTAIIANLAYLTPIVSLFMTHLLLKEEVTLWSLLGLGLILAGILMQMLVSEFSHNAEEKRESA